MKPLADILYSIPEYRKSNVFKGIFVIGAICLITLITITSTSAFYYKTDARNAKTAYLLENNMSISQTLSDTRGGVLCGLSIQFGTFQRVNIGNIKVDLIEDGKVVRNTTYRTEDLVDNAFQNLYFSSPITLNPEHNYSFTISCNYKNKGNEIAVWTALADDSDKLDDFAPISYKQILVNRALQKKIIFFAMPIMLFIIIIILFSVNFNKYILLKCGIYGLIIFFIFHTYIINLFQHIITQIAVVQYTDSNDVHPLEPGEIWQVSYNVSQADFSAFEFFVKGKQNTDLHIQIQNMDTGEKYVDYAVCANDIITDSILNRPAIKISCKDFQMNVFPKGNYQIFFTNTGNKEVIPISTILDKAGNEQINLALIKDSRLGYWLATIILLLICIYLVFITVITLSGKNINAEQFFLVSILFLSIIYFVLMLPWSVPDTGAHLQATYRLSNIILGEKEWNGRLDDILFYTNVWSGSNPSMHNYYCAYFNLTQNAMQTELIEWTNPQYRMEYYSILCYLPQVIGFVIGRLLNLGTVMMIYFGRVCTLILYIIFGYNAVKKIPIGKYIIGGVLLLPMSLMMASAISYDPLVLVSSANFIASIFKRKLEPKKKFTLIECMVWAFVLGGIKGGGYLILLPLVLTLLDRNKENLQNVLILLTGGTSAFLFDVVLPAGSALFQFGAEGSGKLYASYAIEKPLEFLNMCAESYFQCLDYLVINMAGTHIAWLENTIPAFIITGSVFILIIISIYEKDSLRLQSKDKYTMLFVIFLTILLTPAMLLSWTSVGSSLVAGLQGRYYLPILPLLLLILTKFNLHIEIWEKHFYTICNSCCRIFGLFSSIAIYYMLRLYLTR